MRKHHFVPTRSPVNQKVLSTPKFDAPLTDKQLLLSAAERRVRTCLQLECLTLCFRRANIMSGLDMLGFLVTFAPGSVLLLTPGEALIDALGNTVSIRLGSGVGRSNLYYVLASEPSILFFRLLHIYFY